MSRKARRSRSAGRVVRKAPRNKRASVKTVKPDPLDELIAANARTLRLKIDKTWMPAVHAHLQVMLRLGAVVTAFALPDDAEPAPVFSA